MKSTLLTLVLLAFTIPARAETGGNRLELIPTGEENHRKRLELIHAARRTILLSTYAFKGDAAGLEVANALCERALAGVDVRLRLDDFGSRPFRRAARRLRSCGAKVIFDSIIHGSVAGRVYSVHEKLLIVDGERLMLGGSGYSDYYRAYGRDSKEWQDLDARIDGPAACEFHRLFVAGWGRARRFSIPNSDFGGPIRGCHPVSHGESRVRTLFNDPWFSGDRPLLDALVDALSGTKEEVVLYAPYFVPERRLVDALIRARRRGVAVTLLTNSPDSNDEMKLIQIAMDWQAKALLEAGVRILLWGRDTTMHRKGGVFDGRLAFVGSDNLDVRGQNFSSESVAYTDDPAFAAALRAEFALDEAISFPLTEKFRRADLKSNSWFKKLLTRAIRGLL